MGVKERMERIVISKRIFLFLRRHIRTGHGDVAQLNESHIEVWQFRIAAYFRFRHQYSSFRFVSFDSTKALGCFDVHRLLSNVCEIDECDDETSNAAYGESVSFLLIRVVSSTANCQNTIESNRFIIVLARNLDINRPARD